MNLENQPTAEELTADYLPLDTDYDQVAPGFACPNCGEDCDDMLTNGPDEMVTCHSCGYTYSVAGEEAPNA